MSEKAKPQHILNYIRSLPEQDMGNYYGEALNLRKIMLETTMAADAESFVESCIDALFETLADAWGLESGDDAAIMGDLEDVKDKLLSCIMRWAANNLQ